MKKYFLLIFINYINLIFGQDLNYKKEILEINKEKPNLSRIIEIEKILSKSPNDSLKVEVLFTLGKVYFRFEQYQKSFNFYRKALDIANQLKSNQQIGIINEALGNLQFELGNFEKSETLYKTSLLNFIKVNNVNRIAKVKGNLALIDIKKGNIDNAIHSLIELSQIKNLDTVSRSITLMSIGNIYLEKKLNPKLAIEYYQKSIAILKNNQNKNLLCCIYQNIAESYIDLKQYDYALHYNEKSEKLLEIENDNELKATLYLFYSKIFEGKNNIKLALKNYKLYQEYQRQVDKSKNSLLVENLEITYQLKNEEIQNKIKEQKIKILKTEKALAKTKIYLLLLLILTISISLYFIIKKQKIKITKLYHKVLQSKEKLEYTENKTEKIILNIHHNNDFIKRFTKRLREIINDINDDKIKKNLNTLIFELQDIKLPNKKNEELIEDISSTFIYNLEKTHPTLTEEEKKICILIFLNYKNKEIATSLNLSIRSIENCRYRIRKKIKLETSTNLYEYFQGLK